MFIEWCLGINIVDGMKYSSDKQQIWDSLLQHSLQFVELIEHTLHTECCGPLNCLYDAFDRLWDPEINKGSAQFHTKRVHEWHKWPYILIALTKNSFFFTTPRESQLLCRYKIKFDIFTSFSQEEIWLIDRQPNRRTTKFHCE